MIKKIKTFFTREIWETDFQGKSKYYRFVLSAFKIIWLSIRNFNRNQSYLRASALTYWTMLSIVPVVALAFGVAKGFGLDTMLRSQMLEKLPMQETVLLKILDFSQTLLENTRGGVVAGIGVVFLLWSVFKVLANIERAFNHIWGISKLRPLSRNIGNYFSLMLLSPFIVVLSGGITVFISAEISKLAEKISLLGMISPFIIFGLKFLPYLFISILFVFLYILMPNTKVKFLSALVGGVVASILYQLVQWIYIFFQVGVVRLNAIYGSFAALPLFLIWMQTSWVIVLYGTELSCVFQSYRKYKNYLNLGEISFSLKKQIALIITKLIADNYASGKAPVSLQEICDRTGIPFKPAEHCVNLLEKSGVLLVTQAMKKNRKHYQPAVDSEFFTTRFVIKSLEESGYNDSLLTDSKEYGKVKKIAEKLDLQFKESKLNIALKEI